MILFYNLPFELINLKIADIILVVATIISVSSMIEYFSKMDKIIKEIKN